MSSLRNSGAPVLEQVDGDRVLSEKTRKAIIRKIRKSTIKLVKQNKLIVDI